MASSLRVTPLPPFPRWTGMRMHLGPHRIDLSGTTVAVNVSVTPLTSRARLWVAWRLLTRREVPDAPA